MHYSSNYVQSYSYCNTQCNKVRWGQVVTKSIHCHFPWSLLLCGCHLKVSRRRPPNRAQYSNILAFSNMPEAKTSPLCVTSKKIVVGTTKECILRSRTSVAMATRSREDMKKKRARFSQSAPIQAWQQNKIAIVEGSLYEYIVVVWSTSSGSVRFTFSFLAGALDGHPWPVLSAGAIPHHLGRTRTAPSGTGMAYGGMRIICACSARSTFWTTGEHGPLAGDHRKH